MCVCVCAGGYKSREPQASKSSGFTCGDNINQPTVHRLIRGGKPANSRKGGVAAVVDDDNNDDDGAAGSAGHAGPLLTDVCSFVFPFFLPVPGSTTTIRKMFDVLTGCHVDTPSCLLPLDCVTVAARSCRVNYRWVMAHQWLGLG